MNSELSVVSVYVDNFLLTLRTISNLNSLKRLLSNEYDIKDFGKRKTIIDWQITRDPATRTMKLDQSTFIQNLVIEKNLSNYNANLVLIKANSAINMPKVKNYEEKNLHKNQRLIGKMIYLACGTRSDITFVVGQLSKHNVDPQLSHF